MKKLNNKGFTLVELLAVLAILIAIMSIAIPSISSSLERSKNKQSDAKKKAILSAAELYVTDHKNTIYANSGTDADSNGNDGSCYISVDSLKEYLSEGTLDDITVQYVMYNKGDNSFLLESEKGSEDIECVKNG